MLAKAQPQAYSRAEVRRQFALTERQLRSWERESLLPAAESYSFSDLIAIRTIVELIAGTVQERVLQVHHELGIHPPREATAVLTGGLSGL